MNIGAALFLLSGASFVLFCLFPIAYQIVFWLKYDIWLEQDLITYLRYLDISPYTDMKGLNRIIEWFVSIHISPFGLIPVFLFLWVFAYFEDLSSRLEKIITKSESVSGEITPTHTEDDLRSIPTFGLDKIYPVFRNISGLTIWSALGKVWSHFFGWIFWVLLFFTVFLIYFVTRINP